MLQSCSSCRLRRSWRIDFRHVLNLWVIFHACQIYFSDFDAILALTTLARILSLSLLRSLSIVRLIRHWSFIFDRFETFKMMLSNCIVGLDDYDFIIDRIARLMPGSKSILCSIDATTICTEDTVRWYIAHRDSHRWFLQADFLVVSGRVLSVPNSCLFNFSAMLLLSICRRRLILSFTAFDSLVLHTFKGFVDRGCMVILAACCNTKWMMSLVAALLLFSERDLICRWASSWVRLSCHAICLF